VSRAQPEPESWPSRRALVLSLAAVLAVGAGTFSAAILKSPTRSLLKQDGMAYFLYARSLVLDLDFDVTADLAAIRGRFNVGATEAVDRFAREVPQTGRVVLPWPVGVGAVMAPFYAGGLAVEYLLAAVAGRDADTLGAACELGFATGSLIWAWIGFWLAVAACRRVTVRPGAPRGPPAIAMLAVLATGLAGPLVFYTFFHPAMSHAPSFGLVAALVLIWWRAWDHGASVLRFAALAGLCGLVAILRYQNVLFGILPAALLVREALRVGLKGAAIRAAAGAAAFAIPAAIQVGHVVASYGGLDTGAALRDTQNPLDPTSPHFLDALFSCRHGAFYWAPLLGVGAAGLLAAAVREGWGRLFLATFLAEAWLIGSLSGDNNWYASAAFGMRYLIECTPLFSAGLAWFCLRAEPRAGIRTQAMVLVVPVAFNLALILAYSLRTIPQAECVTWSRMVSGIWQVFAGRM